MTEYPQVVTPAEIHQFMEGLKPGMKRQYDRNINRDLSQQNSQELFKRNVVLILQQSYDEAYRYLHKVLAETHKSVSLDLLEAVITGFDGYVDEVVQYALQRHRTSCALSNFPTEHKPDEAYIASVLEEAEQAWQVFVRRLGAV